MPNKKLPHKFRTELYNLRQFQGGVPVLAIFLAIFLPFLETRTEALGSDIERSIVYAYDKVGNRITETRPEGRATNTNTANSTATSSSAVRRWKT